MLCRLHAVVIVINYHKGVRREDKGHLYYIAQRLNNNDNIGIATVQRY